MVQRRFERHLDLLSLEVAADVVLDHDVRVVQFLGHHLRFIFVF